jgi:hypothetical protein
MRQLVDLHPLLRKKRLVDVSIDFTKNGNLQCSSLVDGISRKQFPMFRMMAHLDLSFLFEPWKPAHSAAASLAAMRYRLNLIRGAEYAPRDLSRLSLLP